MRFLTHGLCARVRVLVQNRIEFMRFRKHRFSGREAANDGDIYQVSRVISPQSTSSRANSISLSETVMLLQKSADRLNAYLTDKPKAENEPPKTT